MMDRFEDPEAMLKQAIREMEESIANVSVETAKAIAGEKRLMKELASNELEAQRWNHRAEQAVQNEDDHLARKALSRKKECQNLAQVASCPSHGLAAWEVDSGNRVMFISDVFGKNRFNSVGAE